MITHQEAKNTWHKKRKRSFRNKHLILQNLSPRRKNE
nr:MAG TPA: hypothetical protein [Caudoviricetes sp.]